MIHTSPIERMELRNAAALIMRRDAGKFCSYCGASNERYYSVPTTAAIVDCSTETVWGWVKDRKISSVKINGLRRIPAAELEKITTLLPSIEQIAASALEEVNDG